MPRLAVFYSKQFKKDYKRAQKRGKNMEKLKDALCILSAGRRLPAARKDHPLSGGYAGRRECHLESDWLLVYKIEKERIIFERTGTHGDLF